MKANYDEALTHYRRYLEISTQTGFQWGISGACSNIGSVYLKKGDPLRAEEYFARYLSISQRIGDTKGTALSHLYLGKIYMHGGKRSKAKRSLSNAENLFSRMHDQVHLKEVKTLLMELGTGRKKERTPGWDICP
jgi:tetratricopeptide (TPR) repeat protein